MSEPHTLVQVPEVSPASLRKAWPDPTPEMLADPLFDAIWNVIKTWDINVPDIYAGYCGATGNHARAIYAAIKAWLSGEDQTAQDLIRRAAELMRTSDLPHNRIATLEAEITGERDA